MIDSIYNILASVSIWHWGMLIFTISFSFMTYMVFLSEQRLRTTLGKERLNELCYEPVWHNWLHNPFIFIISVPILAISGCFYLLYFILTLNKPQMKAGRGDIKRSMVDLWHTTYTLGSLVPLDLTEEDVAIYTKHFVVSADELRKLNRSVRLTNFNSCNLEDKD